MSRLLRSLLAVALLGCCTQSTKADVVELADGTKLDGKVFKEDGGFVWLKTLKGVEKVAADKVKSRTPGEADVDRYEKLKAATAVEPITPSALVAALWSLYQFQKEHAAELPPETAKENQKILGRIIKKDADHVGARGELGEVQWNGDWVKKDDIPRLQAEQDRERRRVDWQTRLRVPIVMSETDHFTLLDNTGEKDLAARAKTLEKAWDELTKALGVEKLWKERAVIVTIKAYDPFCKVVDSFAGEAAINTAIVAAAKDRNTGGLWRHTPYAFQIRWPASGTESMWSAIVHNCAHLTVWTIWAKGGRPWEKDATPPAWIDEGMGAWTEIAVTGQQISCCMGESAKQTTDPPGGTTDKNPKKKKDPKKNADSLREAVNQYREKCKEAIESDEFPPMRKFLHYKVGDLGPPEEGGCLGLVTWLMKLDGEKFKKLVAMLHVGGKKVDDEYWREAYGFELIDDMEKKWRGWVMGEWQ